MSSKEKDKKKDYAEFEFRNIGNPSININISGSSTKASDSASDNNSLDSDKLVEFKFDIQNSVNTTGTDPNTPLKQETIVADLTLDDVKAGNKVLLQGLFHVNNNKDKVQDLKVRIYKNIMSPANVIYNMPFIEIDAETRDDQNQPIPVLHVDHIGADATNVRYILTAQGTLTLRGPITFTASEISG